MSRSRVQYDEKAERNYGKEASELVSQLKGSQLYEMYEIVSNQLKKYNSKDRDNELNAVKSAIEKTRGVDEFRLDRIWNGYRSSMAANAKPSDGYTKPAKKKA